MTASGIALLHLGLLGVLTLRPVMRIEPPQLVPVQLIKLAASQSSGVPSTMQAHAPAPEPARAPAPKGAQAPMPKNRPAEKPVKPVHAPAWKEAPATTQFTQTSKKPITQPAFANPATSAATESTPKSDAAPPSASHPPSTSSTSHPKSGAQSVAAAREPAQHNTEDDSPAIELPSTRASYLNNPRPLYPGSSKRLGETGTVLLRVLVGADGSAERVSLKRSSGFDALDNAALETVQRWRFVPGKRKGVPAAMEYTVPIAFRLD